MLSKKKKKSVYSKWCNEKQHTIASVGPLLILQLKTGLPERLRGQQRNQLRETEPTIRKWSCKRTHRYTHCEHSPEVNDVGRGTKIDQTWAFFKFRNLVEEAEHYPNKMMSTIAKQNEKWCCCNLMHYEILAQDKATLLSRIKKLLN